MPTPAEHYAALRAKVDAHVARVEVTHRDDMQCGAGCAACCLAELSVLAIEAEAIAAFVEAMPTDARAAVATRAALPANHEAPRCAALDPDDRCAIYPVRPLVCRSHGVAIRTGDLVDACALNFHKRPPHTLPAHDVLDQGTLSTVLVTIDGVRAAACGNPAGERVPLRKLLATCALV